MFTIMTNEYAQMIRSVACVLHRLLCLRLEEMEYLTTVRCSAVHYGEGEKGGAGCDLLFCCIIIHLT